MKTDLDRGFDLNSAYSKNLKHFEFVYVNYNTFAEEKCHIIK